MLLTKTIYLLIPIQKLECGPMTNVMAAQLNIGGAICESSVIPFLVRRRKLSMTMLECRAVTLPIGSTKLCTMFGRFLGRYSIYTFSGALAA